MEEGQEPGHREAAAGLGTARDPEAGAQHRGIGHRERGAVDQERAVAVPGALGLRVRDEGVVEPAEHGLIGRQGQAGAGLAERRVGERAAGQERDVIQGGVAVEDLDEEPAEDGDGGQQAVAPEVADAAAGVVDGARVEVGVEVLPDFSQGG